MAQIYFPEGTQPDWKFTEIPGGGGEGYDKHPLQSMMEIQGGWGAMTSTPYSVQWKFQGDGGGGYKVNVPFVGGMDIFWKYTIINKMRFLQGSW